MKKFLILPIFLVLFLSIQAHALGVWPASWGQGFQDVTVYAPGWADGDDPDIGTAGLYRLFFYEDTDFNNSPLLYESSGYCVEPFNGVLQGEAELISVAPEYLDAAWLMDKYLPNANSVEQRAGLQLAIWEALLDTGIDIEDEGSTVFDEYTEYMRLFSIDQATDEYASFTGTGYSIVHFINNSADNQDMIVKNPVPEPGTMMLFGIGLLGLTAMGRRKNQ